MAARIAQLILLLYCLFTSLQIQAGLFDAKPQAGFLPAEQAFAFDFSQHDRQLTLSWQVKPGYYLYKQQFRFVPRHARLSAVALPAGESHEDEFFGKSEIYRHQLSLPLTLQQADDSAVLQVTGRGCAEAGFCYPPETHTVPLNVIAPAAESSPPAQAAPQSTPLPFSPLWALLIGIGVAFTPCVLPMYPLISGIILGGNQHYSTRRLLTLAMTYVQGMALTYTLMGMVVAAAGLRFQAALQHPAVLTGLSLLFVLLALSMFGLFSLQLPGALQTRLVEWSNRQQGGSVTGVFLMGDAGRIDLLPPAQLPPLSAILLYIAQSANLLAGAGTLYLYALGMGLPLIVVTLFGNKLLPKSGPWMQTVKEGFGFVILALPVFLMERVWGESWGLRLWSLLGVAFFAWAFISSLRATHGLWRLVQILLLAAALICARPIQDWAFGQPHASQQTAHLPFAQIQDSQQLQQKLRASQGRITMLDLYADWCVACKEFEKYTFSDAGVSKALTDMQLLQANVTANSPRDNALLSQLNVLGLPTILFFDAAGHEIPDSRITGFLAAAAFQDHLRKLRQ